MTNKTIKNLQDMLEIHRYRNGRLEIDYFSRKMSPKFSLIHLDDKYYDRNSLKKYIMEQASNTVPESLRVLSAKEKANVSNKNPFRIFGKAKFFPKNNA